LTWQESDCWGNRVFYYIIDILKITKVLQELHIFILLDDTTAIKIFISVSHLRREKTREWSKIFHGYSERAANDGL
jgi:hypothetical protein